MSRTFDSANLAAWSLTAGAFQYVIPPEHQGILRDLAAASLPDYPDDDEPFCPRCENRRECEVQGWDSGGPNLSIQPCPDCTHGEADDDDRRGR